MKERTPVTNSGLYAIRTRYIGPTDTEGSKIEAVSAQSGGRSLIVSYDHGLDGPNNHAAAAVALANAAKSDGAWSEDIRLVQGAYGEDGYVFVLLWE